MKVYQKPIGGFFELEKSELNSNYHSGAIGLSNGRTCLNVIIKNFRAKHVYVPYYCCDTLLSSLFLNKLKITFYQIDKKLEPTNLPNLKKEELFIYINYFGIKRNYSKYLAGYFGDQIIIDNTHDYFKRGYSNGSSFNSSRKFFGVPDGAYLYSKFDVESNLQRNNNFITEHLFLKLNGKQHEAFESFKRNEMIQNCDPFLISLFSDEILKGINYDSVAEKRRRNYILFSEELGGLNELGDISLENGAVPFCYPFMTKNQFDLHSFYNKKVYIPIYWNEVNERIKEGYMWEKKLTKQVLPLPIDHRYNDEDLQHIIEIVKEIR